MRTGIFGGSFDPVHQAHLIMAEIVTEQMGLDRMVFMPARIPPHKQDKVLSAPEHRLRMLHLAVEDNPRFLVSDFELTRPGISYTVETLKGLREQDSFAGDRFFFIIGADSLAEMRTWHAPEHLLDLARLVCIRRPGISVADAEPRFREAAAFVDAPEMALSSTAIRARIRAGESIRYQVPEAVRRYIETHGLYR